MNIRRAGRHLGWTSLAMIGLLAGLYLYPDPLFAYSRTYGGFKVMSDRSIDPAIDHVLDDATRRLNSSPLHYGGEEFRVYICNERWRLRLFALNPSIGGGTVYGTRNIFIRQANVALNQVVSPNGGPLLDEKDRPLSYFIAHEATHVMELRHFGMLAILQSPFWLVEGYADVVGKGGNFNVDANRDLLVRNDPLLSENCGRHGLYRRYHLMVAAELRRPGVTIDRLFAAAPSESEALSLAELIKP